MLATTTSNVPDRTASTLPTKKHAGPAASGSMSHETTRPAPSSFAAMRQDARPAADVEHRIARPDQLLHRLQAQLRAAMVAGAALRPGIDHQAQSARRRRLGAPRRGDEELLADQQRRKRFLRSARPSLRR